jgi:hypothetical protein
MNSVSSSCYNPADKFSMMQANWAYQSAQIAKAEIAGEQSTDIQIQTADGDKVTLSSDITFESSAIVYEKQGQTSTRYRQSQGQIVSATASSTLELTVEGTLDEQEKKEIKAVLMNLFKMVKDFITGHAATDTEEAQSIADLTTISKVTAEFDIKTSVTVAAQSYAKHVAQTPVEEIPAIQKLETSHIPAVSKRVDKLTDRMIERVKESGVAPSTILDQLDRRLARFSRNFMHAGPAGWHKMQMIQEIMEDFARKLRELSAKNDVGINEELADAGAAANTDDDYTVLETTASFTETTLNAASQEFHFEMEYSVANEN